MNKTSLRHFIALSLIVIAGFVLHTPAQAYTEKWVEQDGLTYYYQYPDDAGADYVPEKFTGWIQDGEGNKYYIYNSRPMKGWIPDNGTFYFVGADGKLVKDQWVGNFYVGSDGAVVTGTEAPDGTKISKYGSKYSKGAPAQELNEKTALYVEVLKKHPDATADFGAPRSGNPQLLKDNINGFRSICYKEMKLYDRKTGELLYAGDGVFLMNAVLERKDNGIITQIRPQDLLEIKTISGSRIFTDPAGYIQYLAA